MISSLITKKDKKKPIRGLYLVTDRGLCTHHNLTTIIEQSVRGGVSMVQLREKSANTKEFLELALQIKLILKNTNAKLIINDRIDIALASRADGIHLGQSDMPVTIARELLGENAIIGLSLENLDQLAQIPQNAKVDYIGVSPIFKTPTKTDTKSVWGINGLKSLRHLTEIPLVAIGGINSSNAKSVIAAGADSLAVVSYLCSSTDPKSNAEEILAQFSNDH
jgi:thiamine-phosphate pyrophosphorylase